MTDQLIEVGQRIRALREIMGVSKECFSNKCGVKLKELDEFESGKKDFSFSFLYNAANVLGVDVVDIMSGESPKLSTACVVRSGEGFEINRRENYSYKHLAYTFKNKVAEPFMVEVEPKKDQALVLQSHEGQEFNFVVSGSMKFYLSDAVYYLYQGDSIYFNSKIPHAMEAVGETSAKFIAVILK